MVIQTALLAEDGASKQENCASQGITFFQVFASTSGLLGLSRSSDYAAVNGYLNALITFRRTFGACGQANMWGQIAGTGLAGHGTGAAGRGGAGEQVEVPVAPPLPRKQEKRPAEDLEYPKEFYQRDLARGDLVVAHREMHNFVEMQHRADLAAIETEGYLPVKGLRVALKTVENTDKVLLICNLPTSTQDNHDGVAWTLKRGSYLVGPHFVSWTHSLGQMEGVLMPWLDEPGKARMELDYSVHCRLKGSVQLSKDEARRALTAVVIPGGQVTSARSHEVCTVGPGRWHDVPGLQQISATNAGEKVLVICTVKYTALWADENVRGRFTILRDGRGLDPDSYGLQSVRSLQKDAKRSMVIALIDDPEPGPHLYQVKAAVTSEENATAVCQLDDDDRQLSLIRLPGKIVTGPSRCSGPASVTEDTWTEIPGLSVTVEVSGAHDKVLVVYNTNFNPSEFKYEAYFTLFRTSDHAGARNLGHPHAGLHCVASAASASSEYPVGMLTDAPGVGRHTYSVHARTCRCEDQVHPPEIEVGPDGQIAAVQLGTRTNTSTLGDEMAKEIAEAMAGRAAPVTHIA